MSWGRELTKKIEFIWSKLGKRILQTIGSISFGILHVELNLIYISIRVSYRTNNFGYTFIRIKEEVMAAALKAEEENNS